MSWREPPAPNAPTLAHLVEEELHLVVNCHGCHREIRLTPTEAVELLGPDCTILGARDRLRCSWCGAAGSSRIDARPCSQDMSAKRHLEAARHQRMVWPQDPTTALGLAEAEAAWALRRPRDGGEGQFKGYRLKTPLSEITCDLNSLGLPLLFPGGAMPNDWPEIEWGQPPEQLPVLRPLDALDPGRGLTLAYMRWGLVPFFYRGPLAGWTRTTAQVRVEAVAASRTFKGAFERRRCLVPADLADAWAAKTDDGPRVGSPRRWATMAAIWDRAETADGLIESFAVLTVSGGSGDWHVPLALAPAEVSRWLDLSAALTDILRPARKPSVGSILEPSHTDVL